MTTQAPLKFMWDGSVMTPARGYAARAERQFTPFETYTLEVREDRSAVQHKHFFASIADAFTNLDDRCTKKIKTPEHLRKWALIETGWFDEHQIECGSNEVALRMATFVRSNDDYCEIIVRGPVLVVRTAKSQSQREMDKKEFQKSSSDVLDLLADMIGVNRTILKRYAGKAA